MIGTFDTVAPTAAQLETVAQVVAWKTAAHGVDPHGIDRDHVAAAAPASPPARS